MDALGIANRQGIVGLRVHFHNGIKSLLLPLDTHVNAVQYNEILQNTMLLLARQYFHNEFSYREDHTVPHRARIVNAFL